MILIAEIDEREAAGRDPWTAVLEATEHRMRPILLTAAAASLGKLRARTLSSVLQLPVVAPTKMAVSVFSSQAKGSWTSAARL